MFDPDADVPPAPPPFGDGAAYAMSPDAFDARVAAWRDVARDGSLDSAIRGSDAWARMTRARELRSIGLAVALANVVATASMFNGATRAIETDPAAVVAALEGECARGDDDVSSSFSRALFLLARTLARVAAACAALVLARVLARAKTKTKMKTKRSTTRVFAASPSAARVSPTPAEAHRAEDAARWSAVYDSPLFEDARASSSSSHPTPLTPLTPPPWRSPAAASPSWGTAGLMEGLSRRSASPSPSPSPPRSPAEKKHLSFAPPPPPPPPPTRGRTALSPLVAPARSNASPSTQVPVPATPPSTLRRSRAMSEVRRTISARANAPLRERNAAERERSRSAASTSSSTSAYTYTSASSTSSTPKMKINRAAVAAAEDVLRELKAKSPFLRAVEREAKEHAREIHELRAKLEALDGTSDASELAALRAHAERVLARLSDERGVLELLQFPTHRLECLRAATNDRDALASTRAALDRLFVAEDTEKENVAPSRDSHDSPRRPRDMRRAEKALTKCAEIVRGVERNEAESSARFAAAGVPFYRDEISRLKEAAVAMTGRVLRAALRRSNEMWAATRAREEEEGVGREECGVGNMSEGVGEVSEKRAAAWKPPTPVRGSSELWALRFASDLAYRAYSSCGGVDDVVEDLSLRALEEMRAYGDDAWAAASITPPSSFGD